MTDGPPESATDRSTPVSPIATAQAEHSGESAAGEALALLRRGVKMFRTTYGSKSAFASRANEWVADAERLLQATP